MLDTESQYEAWGPQQEPLRSWKSKTLAVMGCACVAASAVAWSNGAAYGRSSAGVSNLFEAETQFEVVNLTVGTVHGTDKPMYISGRNSERWGRYFRGIRYAKSGRFEEPTLPDPVQVIDAQNYKPACPRGGAIWGETGTDMSEDCQYLNVYTPDQVAGERMLNCPVAVWFHGGSYTMGAGSDTHKESVNSLVKDHRLIVVTINYRLGVFGFLGSERLRTQDGSTGNFGTLDQQMALRWVKRNIKYFGGDDSKITIFGWSAGAAAASVHMATPHSGPHSSKGLYSRAVMMSGGFTSWAAISMASSESLYESMLTLMGCHDHADCQAVGPPCECMLKKDGQELLDKQPGWGWGPTIDGAVLEYHPLEAFKRGKTHQGVPIIIGSAIEDALQDIGKDATKEDFVHFVGQERTEFHDVVDNITELYMSSETIEDMMGGSEVPGNSDANKWYHAEGGSPAYWSARRVIADWGMTCLSRRVARGYREKAGAEAYWYVFAEGSLPLYKLPDRRLSGTCWPCPGATHGSDLPFLFETPETNVVDSLADLADAYHTFFANFVDHGDPNSWHNFQMTNHGRQAWPSASDVDLSGSASGGMAFSAANVSNHNNLRSKFCDFWDKFDESGGAQPR